ncbi:chemotaxis protein CheB [Thalassomonas actiniarum]|uniref:protein-glutamate methylesterase n=1 Tax=Thalassomonas actiniarum TaxID=485447 RepID=A0AAE9YLB5_9GAMM|nr:chemotaxis protein CheB [Thalassomonas actiniarum]WDD96808.1 chemotaxis protein CheB [Thalassomonas actiniarum]
MKLKQYHMLVIGASAGGLNALGVVLGRLPGSFPAPVLVVQHQGVGNDSEYLALLLDSMTALRVREARAGEVPLPGSVYISPAGYHLQLELSGKLSLSVDLPVNFSIPSIDVLFDTAADALGTNLAALILTGASSDGSMGLKNIKGRGGLTLVQSPQTAQAPQMPEHAIANARPDFIVPLQDIGALLCRIFLVKAVNGGRQKGGSP